MTDIINMTDARSGSSVITECMVAPPVACNNKPTNWCQRQPLTTHAHTVHRRGSLSHSTSLITKLPISIL